MKKCLLLILFFAGFFFTQLNATDWFPVGAKWTWGLVQECCGPPPRPDYPFYWNVVKDTIIQNKHCSIIEKEGSYFPQQSQWTYRYIYNNSNDTISRFINNNFLPVYNFNCSVGDTTYIVTDSGNYVCDTFLFVIDSIKPLLQNNNLRVQYGKLITNINCFFSNQVADNLIIIEKVGLSHLYTKAFYFVLDVYHGYPRCYEDASFNLHLSTISCDSIIDNIKEKFNTNLPVKIYPNPASENLLIEFIKGNKYQHIKIELINMQGEVLKSLENERFQFYEININDISNGIYWLKVIADTEFITKQIIVKH